MGESTAIQASWQENNIIVVVERHVCRSLAAGVGLLRAASPGAGGGVVY